MPVVDEAWLYSKELSEVGAGHGNQYNLPAERHGFQHFLPSRQELHGSLEPNLHSAFGDIEHKAGGNLPERASPALQQDVALPLLYCNDRPSRLDSLRRVYHDPPALSRDNLSTLADLSPQVQAVDRA